MTELDNLINRLCSLDSGELTLFLGAGVSVNSGLPTSISFLNETLDYLGIQNKDKEKLILNRNKLSLPFESFIEVFFENSLDFCLLNIFRKGQPNANHQFSCELLKSKIISEIYTTNFDCMFETELKNQKFHNNKDYEVFYKENHFNQSYHSSFSCPFKIFKIHGCINDEESIRTTLKSVANKYLSEERQSLIRDIFLGKKNQAILILGYSCSDYFDIIPEIEKIRGSSIEIFYVQHDAGIKEKKLCKVENISQQSDNNPFKNFNGYRIFVNTDSFVKWMSDILGFTPKYSRRHIVDWKKDIAIWISKFETDHIAFTILGQLFYRLSNFDKSLFYYNKALKIDKIKKDIRREAIVLNNIGLLNQDICNYYKAIEYHKKSLNLFLKIEFLFGIGAAYSNLGYDYAYVDWKKCLVNCEKAIEYSQKSGLRFIEANALNNIGLMYKNNKKFDKALKYYLNTLEIDKEGNIIGQSVTLKNIGNIYLLKNEYNKAVSYYKDALDISIKIGYKLNEADVIRNLALVYKKMGKEDISSDYFKQSEKTVKQYNLKLVPFEID